MIRAKVVSNRPASCLYVTRKNFFEYMTNADIVNYMDACKEYTDYAKEGKDLMVEFKKTKYTSKTLLDALNFNPPKAFNLRSQEAPRSWLGNE